MSRTLTPPIARIPIGTVQIAGRSVDVQQHPEFVRFFFDLFTRVGSTDAMSNTELAELIAALDDAAGRIDVLTTGLAAIQTALTQVQAGEMLMQSAPQIDPIGAEVTWQI